MTDSTHERMAIIATSELQRLRGIEQQHEQQKAQLTQLAKELHRQIESVTPAWHKQPPPQVGSIEMRNGYMLHWRTNEAGGRVYSSDEIPTGVEVWDTCLVHYETLLEAITLEMALLASELRAKE
jgi:hypothetical protein